LVKKEKKIFSYQYMTIHTLFESPGRVNKNYAVLKIIYDVIRPKKAKNRVKMLKNPLFEVERNLKKSQNSHATNFFQRFTSNLTI
jgi:hypothetical protein